MRILIGHNRYQIFGGEDAVVQAEAQLLKDRGHEVYVYERNNAEFHQYSFGKKIKHLLNLSWSHQTFADIKAIIKEFKPDVAHFHNIFLMISPSAYYACREEGVPVVQSQHNFRLLCANGLFYRDNKVCEDCVKKTRWQGVLHRCYRRSTFLTTCVTHMIAGHWRCKTWTDVVDVYIMAAKFTKNKYVQNGIPDEKIILKPNFLYPDPGYKPAAKTHALYVGRLSEEKGVETLLEAWKSIHAVPLKVMGSGPLSEKLKAFVKENNLSNIEFLGFVSQKDYEKHMRSAKFIIIPSRCYENFPRIVAEAYAYGVPVVASRLGSLAEIVTEQKTGLLFEPGEVADLIIKIQWMEGHPSDVQRMGNEARKVFEDQYSSDKNYELLISVYEKARRAREK